MGASLEKARNAKRAAPARLAIAGALKVNGIGLARSKEGGWALKVNLEEAAPEGAPLPEEIAGVPVVYEVVGTLRARDSRRRG